MPHRKSRPGRKTGISVSRLAQGRVKPPSVLDRNGPDFAGCIANSQCTQEIIEGAPIPLCGKHIREVYEFAQDLVTERWDGAVREYVADLQDRFKPPQSVTKRPRPGYVYFVRLGDRIKIGYSENVARRLTVIPHEEVLGVVPGTREDEQGWHQLLADYRTVGEWFRAEPDVLAAVARVAAAVS